MRKVINIDGRDVGFKASASIVYKYQSYFKKDLLKIIMPVIKSLMPAVESGTLNDETALNALEQIELIDMYNLIWVMAKLDNNDISQPEEWYDSFEQFPALEILKELFEILLPSMFTTEESKKKMMNLMAKK